jgi:hypothetical protein
LLLLLVDGDLGVIDPVVIDVFNQFFLAESRSFVLTGLSDRFAAGFNWLDKLGQAAMFNVSVVCRQDLFGFNYGLLAQDGSPNPGAIVTFLAHSWEVMILFF